MKTGEMLLREIENRGKIIIVLDDDPTGTQTVHDIAVYTDWKRESIYAGFAEPRRMFYILTNSRALTEEQTIEVHRKIAENIMAVSKKTGKDFMVISRGDSTLRGHFPLETKVLKETMEKSGRVIHGEILIPFFLEGGRYTIEDTHYVNCNGELVPAGKTEFAMDKTFGYESSNLRNYIEEKTKGEYRAESVISISLESLRNKKIDEILKQLLEVDNFQKVIVNAVEYKDIEIFCIALHRAMLQNKYFLFRTAASFVKVIGGISDKAYLDKKDIIRENNQRGGMIIIGSHTKKTTTQLEKLKGLDNVEFLEFNSDLVLEDKLPEEVNRVVEISEKRIIEGTSVVVYTKRRLLALKEDTPEEALIRSVKISEAVKDIVAQTNIQPSFMIAKGGITSSDIGVKALNIKRAIVKGQIKPGVPVWKADEESKFPGISYIIFPGNVGEDSTLREIVEILISSGPN